MRKLAFPGVSVALFLLSSCGSDSDMDRTSGQVDASVLFSELEERLASARTLEISFHVTSEGVVESDLEGEIRFAAEESTELRADGNFAGQPVDLVLLSDGERYEFGNGAGTSEAATPPHLREALVIGFTRMGILHNLAMLTGNAPPDGADGGVKEWVMVDAFALEEGGGGGGISEVVSFSMTVSGTPVGTASLEIDADGLPLVRRQVVQFPEGEMRVVERYHTVSIIP